MRPLTIDGLHKGIFRIAWGGKQARKPRAGDGEGSGDEGDASVHVSTSSQGIVDNKSGQWGARATQASPPHIHIHPRPYG